MSRRLASIVLSIVAGCAAGCTDDGGPRLERLDPASAPRGGVVTLTGSRLCGVHADCARAAGEVQLGLSPPTVIATVVSYTETSAQIMIPPVTPTGPTQLVVTVNERSSNALALEVLP